MKTKLEPDRKNRPTSLPRHRGSAETTIVVSLIGVVTLWMGVASTEAQIPDHPVISEVFNNPAGLNDGPVGRDPTNLHQEYIEIYLPPASALDPALNKDALRLTFYEVEGDSSSSGLGLVNYRFDLPTFDLDSTNGVTEGALERPASGVVVLGWVDYIGDPPFDLAGTPTSRIALIDGGVTSVGDFVFVAINGHHFSGTENFPTLVAESLIDVPDETLSGTIQNGSGVYLLVNRDDPGYVELFDDKHVPAGESADPGLPDADPLEVSCFLDGFAANDDEDFDVTQQPYDESGEDEIDLQTVLPDGGEYSMMVPQLAEGLGIGYARMLIDLPKTSEDTSQDNDDPVQDALNAYQLIEATGPFIPTPGRAVLTNSPPELGVSQAIENSFTVLTETTGRPGIYVANIGGSAIDVSAVAGPSSDESVATFSSGPGHTDVGPQTAAYPAVEVNISPGVSDGALASATVEITATNTNPEDPPVVNPVQSTEFDVVILHPTTGLDENGVAFQGTVVAAFMGLPTGDPVLNELRATSLGDFLVANFGELARDSFGNGLILLNPATDLENPLVAVALEEEMPEVADEFINVPSPAGLDDLVQTVLDSAEIRSGALTYAESFNDEHTLVQAIEVDDTGEHQFPETFTTGGTFTPTEIVHFADAKGTMGDPGSGLAGASTSRTFELVLVDTNMRLDGTIETGATDDYGVVFEVGQTEPDATVVTGEFIFLSYSGGLEGADLDPLEELSAPNSTTLYYFDLDMLHDVMGIVSVTRMFIIDGSGNGEINPIEIFSLNAVKAAPAPCEGDANGDGVVDPLDSGFVLARFGCPVGTGDPSCDQADQNDDGTVDPLDSGFVLARFGDCP